MGNPFSEGGIGFLNRSQVALYTPDSRYANAFMDYCLRHEDNRLNVKSYTNAESLDYAIRNEKFELLLVDGLFANDPVMNYECKKAILSHNKYISDPSILAIFLYQKIELVFKQIYELLSEEAVKAVYSCAAVSSMPDIYGVYSPCYPLEREQFAKEIAEYTGENRKVLYINFAGLTESDMGDDDGISELLLYLQQPDKAITYKIQALIRHEKNYDYLPGVKHYQDIAGIDKSDIKRLIAGFEQLDCYDLVIADVGLEGESARELLQCCTKVWMPVNNHMGYGRQEHFLHDLAVEKNEGILELIEPVSIPEGWYARKDIRVRCIKRLKSISESR